MPKNYESQDSVIKEEETYIPERCNPFSNSFQAIVPVIEAPYGHWSAWPGWTEHHNKMRKKALSIARSFDDSETDRPRKFSGSLERGVHVRATLESVYKRMPQLYVKKRRPSQMYHQISDNTPVVWILNDCRNFHGKSSTIARPFISNRVGCFSTYKNERMKGKKGESKHIVKMRELVGAISFCDLKKKLEETRYSLLPTSRSVTKEYERYENPVEGLFYVAASYFAQQNIVCVVDDELISSIQRIDIASQHIVRMSKFTNEEIENLRFIILCLFDNVELDSNSGQPNEDYIEQKYGDLVSKVWPPS